MCDPELGALEDIRGDISVPLTRMLGHWWAISGPEMLLKPEVYDEMNSIGFGCSRFESVL